ncbi:MAG: hypothetical protein SFU56_07115 [Capsulimonadales bacterium]|nr:hypothetical protein [Capsulimonadales bacterium]
MNLYVYAALGLVAVGVVVYWWSRPVDWSDGEGTGEPNHPMNDTDAGSFRWWFVNGTDEGRTLGSGLNLRDWWENERRRWRR